jgi:hypothetical protein
VPLSVAGVSSARPDEASDAWQFNDTTALKIYNGFLELSLHLPLVRIFDGVCWPKVPQARTRHLSWNSLPS